MIRSFKKIVFSLTCPLATIGMLTSVPGRGLAQETAIDDSDLAGDGASLPETSHLGPTTITVTPDPATLVIRILTERNGKKYPIRYLNFGSLGVTNASGKLILAPVDTDVRLTTSLANKYYKVSPGNLGRTTPPYELDFSVPGSGRIDVVFQSDTPGGQVLEIWRIASLARTKLRAKVGLAFWTDFIHLAWPQPFDQASGTRVNITDGKRWDIVGHELGHAIDELAGLTAAAGGAHKIDECYTAALALREGFASFFSAWLSLNLRAADPKFEFIVPRLAPIEVENIPDSNFDPTIPGDKAVCTGPTNEWRVMGFLWDIMDKHDDGEDLELTFHQIWRAIFGKRVSSIAQVYRNVTEFGAPPMQLREVWRLNKLDIAPVP